jgi:PAS domain S-box-containing protein
MAYWWGPRVLLGVYLNAVVCTPLWGLSLQWSFLYALPETIEVGLSWLLFIKFAQGKYWLPNLKHVNAFLLFGSLIPTLFANLYLVVQLYLLQAIHQSTIWENWQVLISADLATQLVFAVPVLVIFTRVMMERGWTNTKDITPRFKLLPDTRDSWFDKIFIIVTFGITVITISLIPVHDMRVGYGFLMIYIAIRYGVNMAILSSSWIGILAFLLPLLLKGDVGLAGITPSDFLATNFDILFLCGVTLITGRAISDLFIEITEHKQVEENLHKAESKYRTLVEQIPPIIYIADPDQRIGVTYISPRIETLGFSQEEWIADPQLWFRQIHPQDQGRVLAEIEQDEQSGKLQAEYRLISRDGKIRWFLDEAVKITDKDGRVLFRQGFMLDITERKQIEESLFARETYLDLLNEMTRAALLSKDFDSTLQTLAENLAKLIHADDCYIARWDEERQKAIPVATTTNIGRIYSSYRDAQSKELKMVLSVLSVGHALAVDDVYDSAYVDLEFVKRFPIRSGLGIPLIVGEHKLGAAVVAFNTPHHFTEEEIQQAEQAGNQVALALWNFQQSVEIQQRLRESNTLGKIERALSETERVGTGEVLQLIVDSARELMPNVQQSVIHLLVPEENVLLAQAVSGYNGQDKQDTGIKMHVGEGVAGRVIQEGVTVNVSEIQAHPDFVLKDSPPDFRSLLVAPVQSSGQQIGTISVQSNIEHAFSAKDAELLNALAVQAAIAIENTRLFETTQQSLKEVNILYQISRGLAVSLDADELIGGMIRLLQQNFNYYSVQICLVDPETRNLVIRHGSGYMGDELVEQQYQILAGEGIVGYVAETGKPFMTNNVDEVAFFKGNPLLPHTKFEMAIPIKLDDRIIGVLDIQQTRDHNKFSSNDLGLMIAIADQLALVLQKANLYSTLQASLEQEKKVRSQLLQSERLALVGRLLASVSHELNNPLQAIQYGLFLLRDEINLSNQARQDVEVLIAETERMTALIERLRSAYRPLRAQDFQSIPLNSLIEDVHALMTTYMHHNEIAFEFIPDAELPNVSGLPDQIRQVLLNLFLNAVEVMQPGGRLTVQTCFLPQEKEALLVVKDTGPGIDPEVLSQIFDAFISNKPTGTGLGLTITHDIIQQHKGRIQAENDPEAGAIFKVWLPVEERN